MVVDATHAQSLAVNSLSKSTQFSSLSSQLSPGSIGHFLIAHPDPSSKFSRRPSAKASRRFLTLVGQTSVPYMQPARNCT